ncbi:dihydroxyacetone kinase subunit DhaK [Thalassobium sp. R2A62]|uniref:dihydroxyacetone kinase subunit DhaK n=1 Tax=Thalassobium sp. R2A62 TaxID=633131 RepID=UPI0001B1D5CB|nr:dihydroxyacetone kinase subunit DhaK [Thalassobium sp. R2A62]EET49560.1 dihydroxyacetone kinase [Thalassobium sp. R2A62]MDG1339419.1 dihydroxyacetone kinase subunit DhaK [Paracoccaceae bacterium]
MKQFINAKEDIVTDAIDGTIAASGGALTRLDGYPHIRVVVRADWDKSKVALVSGGGSGHEPAHAGFIGKGMLTAAVCGDVFASPSVDAVLAGILAVTGPAGCLLIVKNYTGDRLNFGLAAERARAFGHKVSIVIVDDDVALPELPQARGLAGTLFVHKIAGAMAENGATLDTCTKAAERVIGNSKSIGMSLDTCNVPGSQKEDRVPEGMAELGLGIHGEAGVEQIAADGAKYSVNKVAEKLLATMSKTPHAVLVNNLGGATELEMAILTKELIEGGLGERADLMVGPSSMMTALDMHGFSISALELTEDDEAMLAQPVECASWPGCMKINSAKILPLPDGLSPIRAPASEHANTKDFLLACCEILIASESDLNTLDAKSGDGDTGSTLAGAARALTEAMDTLPLADQTQLYRAIGLELSQTMGGSSGVLLAIFFAAAGDASSAGQPMTDALKSGLARLCQIGGANPGDRTMVDALAPALDALDGGLESAAIAARKGADYTATLTRAKAGRATYINAQQLSGHVDPGAEAVARLFEHLSK